MIRIKKKSRILKTKKVKKKKKKKKRRMKIMKIEGFLEVVIKKS